MTGSRRPGRNPRSHITSAATPVAARPGLHFGGRGYLRPLLGALTIGTVLALVAGAIGLFRGDFSETVPVTVISDRAGLVMNPDAKVKMNDIQVGTVSAIEQRPDGTAALHLALDRSTLHLIPADVRVGVASSTVFGAKFVEFVAPPNPSADPLRAGQVIDGDHVTVEINTIFEQLTDVLSTIEPENLNRTLTALSSGFSGRGALMGQMITDLDATLAELDPVLDDLGHDIAVAPPVLNTYADVAPDLLATVDRATTISRTIVDQQRGLDALLVSVIGLADAGTDVLATNHRPLADVLHMLAPVTALTHRYDAALYCALAGAIPLAKVEPPRVPGGEVLASFVWGADPYRYPSDLPKVAATGGPQCLGLPDFQYETRAPYLQADVGTELYESGHCTQRGGHQGVPPGPPPGRTTAQRQPDRDAGMTRTWATALKFGAFGIVMVLLTAGLFAVFGQYRGGSANRYSAVFSDVSDLQPGDSVRVAGIRVGTVTGVALRSDQVVVVDFEADRKVVLTTGSRAAVRYLNLMGDRYLELVDGPGGTDILAAGAQIPADRTLPALDLDVLLNGLKPVVQGLDPRDVNQLSTALVQIMQGQEGTVESLLSQTSSFTNALADNGAVVEELIDNLNVAMATLAQDGERFSGAIEKLRQLVGELSAERQPIGAAIGSLADGTASLAGLLGQARAPLAATVDELTRLAPAVDDRKDLLDAVLQKSPENYRKLARMGSYGSFFNYYLCGVTVRVSDLEGRTAVFPWIKQDTGRCAEIP